MVEWTILTSIRCMQRSTVKTVGWQSGVASQEVEQDVDDLDQEDALDMESTPSNRREDDDDDDDGDADADADVDLDADDDDDDEEEEEEVVVSAPSCIVSAISLCFPCDPSIGSS